MPISTVVAGPLVTIVIVGRPGLAIPSSVRRSLARTAYRPIEILAAEAGEDRAGTIERLVMGAGGELICLFDPAADPVRPDWLGHLVESVLGGAAAAGPLVIRGPERRPVPADQDEADLTLLSAGIDFQRAYGVALPRHLRSGGDPTELAGRVVAVPALSAACLVVRRADLVEAGIPRGYVYDGAASGPAAAPLFDADLAIRLRGHGGRLLRDGRAAVLYRVGRASPIPRPLPAVSRSIPAPNPDRTTFLGRWGPRLAREVFADIVAGRHAWSLRPLTIVFAGRPPTALPPGTWAGTDWHLVTGPQGALDTDVQAVPGADVLIAADPAVDLRPVPSGIVRVLWLSGPGEPPIDPQANDLIVAADPTLAVDLEQATGKPVTRASLTSPGAAAALQGALLTWNERRRFAIRIGASNWDNIRTWGDFAFGRLLQRALERAGHPTRLRLLRDWTSDGAARDDATIHLFGKAGAENRPAQVNVLWQISHPDRASVDLYDRYDIAFVASEVFARRMADLAHVPVASLLQATDPERFRPADGGPSHELLFVANHRPDRPVINWLVPTDHDLAIYGRGWLEAGLDGRFVKGDHIENDVLNRYYSAAAIVLNDTWADMREAGFIPNRVYDALACGAFVLSDAIDGLEAAFDGAVVGYHDRDELRTAVEHYLADSAGRRALAERGRRLVIGRDTFADRARTLIAAIEPRLAGRSAWIDEAHP